MYKYYYSVDKNNNVIDCFNGSIRKPTEDDIFYKEISDRHFHMDLYDSEKQKYLYTNDNGTMRLKTAIELQDTPEEIQEKLNIELNKEMVVKFFNKVIEIAKNNGTMEDVIDWVKSKIQQLGL